MKYQTQFENIFSCMLGLPPEALNDIHNELMVLRPYNLANAIGLAKLAAAIPPFNLFPWPPRSLAPSSLVLGLPPTLSTLPTCKLYPKEMQECRACGLCFYCDVKFGPGQWSPL